MAQRVLCSVSNRLGLFLGSSRVAILSEPKTTTTTTTIRLLTTSLCRFSLNEFFDDPKNYGAIVVKSGRPWRVDELRLKSNSDLHKLWFVLYKERNMLYTMQENAKIESELFPSPERIDKVEESMGNLENVVRERNKAYWQLEVSPCSSGERLPAFRRDVFGRPRWHRCSQHLVPYHRNRKFIESKGPGKHDETERFFNHYREMQRKRFNSIRSQTARNIRHLLRRFPKADVEYIAEQHPEFPDGYIKHLRDNIHLYDDPPTRAEELNLKNSVRALTNRKEEESKLLQ